MTAQPQSGLFGEVPSALDQPSAEVRALEGSLMVNFKPPGPVAAAWMNCWEPMPFIMGPVGSAKTTSAFMKGVHVARLQHPSSVDGMRKVRICVVRQTYRLLWRTTIPSYLEVFPKDLGVWEGGKGDPAKHTFRLHDPKFGTLHLEFEFAAISDLDLETFCQGYQVTAWHLEEADEMPPDCLGMFASRTGRAFLREQPDPEILEARGLKPGWNGVYGVLNAPDEDNWFSDVIADPPEGFRLFKQPSGFDPEAENLQVLRRIHQDYYRWKAGQMKPWQVRRFIENKSGYSRGGEPVYTNFGDHHAAAARLSPEPGSPLTVGIDQGLTPAAVICQETRDGQFLALREIVTPPGEVRGASAFGEAVARVLLTEYRAWCTADGLRLVFDPAANARGSDAIEWYRTFLKGFLTVVAHAPYRLAPTNKEQARIDAVDLWLRAMCRGEPAFRVDPECRWLRRGFSGGYKIARVAGRPGEFHDTVADSPYTHIHDALQYAALLHRPEAAARAGSNRNNPGAAPERARRGGLKTGTPVLH